MRNRKNLYIQWCACFNHLIDGQAILKIFEINKTEVIVHRDGNIEVAPHLSALFDANYFDRVHSE